LGVCGGGDVDRVRKHYTNGRLHCLGGSFCGWYFLFVQERDRPRLIFAEMQKSFTGAEEGETSVLLSSPPPKKHGNGNNTIIGAVATPGTDGELIPHEKSFGTMKTVKRVFELGWALGPAAIKTWLTGRYEHMKTGLVRGGVVCIKLGQWASERSDIFSEECTDAFHELLFSVNHHSMEETERALMEAFGKSSGELFESFEPEPIASGSVGQVHVGFLSGGQKVAVKVLHPEVEKQVEQDIHIMKNVFKWVKTLRAFDFKDIKARFENQLDLTHEADNLRKFQKIFENARDVIFPSPIMESRRVLVEEFQEGYHFEEFSDKYKDRTDLIQEAVTLRIATYYCMGWYHNFLHGDMHRGNIMYRVVSEELLPCGGGSGEVQEGGSGEVQETKERVQIIFVDTGVVCSVQDHDAWREFTSDL
jgi:Predicted unusual protein kinase